MVAYDCIDKTANWCNIGSFLRDDINNISYLLYGNQYLNCFIMKNNFYREPIRTFYFDQQFEQPPPRPAPPRPAPYHAPISHNSSSTNSEFADFANFSSKVICYNNGIRILNSFLGFLGIGLLSSHHPIWVCQKKSLSSYTIIIDILC